MKGMVTNMENPKIRIESDGNKTEVFVDGKKIDKSTNIYFQADPVNIEHNVRCIITRYKADESGNYVIENGELVKEIAFDL
jgi:hypothetical protein